MWEKINEEYIWIDKEMGWEEYERYNSVDNDQVCSCDDVRDHGRRLTAGGVALGVAGGMIAGKAATRVGSWLAWIAVITLFAMIVL